MNWLEIGGLLLASGVISLATTILLLRKASTELKLIIDETLETMFEGFNKETMPLVRRAMSIAGSKGAEIKQIKKAEKLVAEDIMENMPELSTFLEMLSPKTLEYFETNPEVLLKMVERWGPKLKLIYDTLQTSGTLTDTRRPGTM